MIVIWWCQGRLGSIWLALCASAHCNGDGKLERGRVTALGGGRAGRATALGA
jgi:hypothetical protein